MSAPFPEDLILRVYDRLEEGPCDRATLCRELGAAWTTVFDTLGRLLNQGLVKKSPVQDGRRGRPRVLWAITPLWEAEP